MVPIAAPSKVLPAAQPPFEQIEREAESHRRAGRQVVVVQGLGFVGTAVAAAIAAARTSAGAPRYFVIGVDAASSGGRWKVAQVNAGASPIVSPDPALPALIGHAVQVDGNLRATVSERVYGLADVVVIDLPLDVRDPRDTEAQRIDVDLDTFRQAVRAVGRHMRPDALVLVETTVPVGTCERVVLPALREERARRGIDASPYLAHAYERVMPGPNYVDSIRRFWRVFSGIDEASATRAREFLRTYVDTESFPLCELDDTASSELAKLLENSYRAANIALIQEWTLLAERIGVNLFAVIDAIRVRKGSHDNMRYPGFGVGGYCLTKDSLLAQWSARHLYESDVTLPMTLHALRTNYEAPLHTLGLLRSLLDGRLRARKIAVCGVSYLAEVADTRNSPTELLVERLLDEGAEVILHDPYVRDWPERPADTVHTDLARCLTGVDAVVLAVPHPSYLQLDATALMRLVGGRCAIVDTRNILSDATAASLHHAGWQLAGVGKGHWRMRGYQCAS